MDDFDWIRNTEPYSLDSPWIIYDDIGTLESDHEIQYWLFSQGWGWDLKNVSERFQLLNHDRDSISGPYYFNTANPHFPKNVRDRNTFDGYSNTNNNIKSWDEEGVPTYYWSAIKNDYKI